MSVSLHFTDALFRARTGAQSVRREGSRSRRGNLRNFLVTSGIEALPSTRLYEM